MNKWVALFSLYLILIACVYFDFIKNLYHDNPYYDYGICKFNVIGCVMMKILQFLDILIVVSARMFRDVASLFIKN